MSSKIKTYNPKEVTIAAGSHIVTGFADDTFISIEANGDGITKKVGCDGEIVRAVSPDNTFKVNITLLQTSDSNTFFSEMCDRDLDTGDGTRSSSNCAWTSASATGRKSSFGSVTRPRPSTTLRSLMRWC